MSGKQSVIAAGGAGLIMLNYWSGPGRQAIKTGLLTKGSDQASQQAAHAQLVTLGTSVLFVAGAVLLAGLSDAWATVMLTILAGIVLLWTINHYGGRANQ